jgi:hypothetical protein
MPRVLTIDIVLQVYPLEESSLCFHHSIHNRLQEKCFDHKILDGFLIAAGTREVCSSGRNQSCL